MTTYQELPGRGPVTFRDYAGLPKERLLGALRIWHVSRSINHEQSIECVACVGSLRKGV